MVTEVVPVEKNEDVPATEALAGLMPAPPTRLMPTQPALTLPGRQAVGKSAFQALPIHQ